MPVDVRLEDAGFAQVSRILRQAGEDELRRAMTKEAREIAKPILQDLRKAVLALDADTRSSGTARAKRTAKAVGRAESAFGYSDRQIEKADRRGGSLRQAVARSLRIVARDSGYKVGVRIKTEGSRLPEDQRYLPRGLDSAKGWRHPVFGTDEWVTQYGNPPGWFLSTAGAHGPMASRRLQAVVQKYINELAKRLDRAA